MMTAENAGKRVVIGMSGGVDSSVAAALLKSQGYEVIGMMLRLWNSPCSETENRCCTPDDVQMARQIAGILDIPFYVLDASELFYENVVKDFFQEYMLGNTPNPCIICNRLIRWGFMLEKIMAMDVHYLATGHYACIQHNTDNRVLLTRPVDASKDQTYVLSDLSQAQLQHTLLPLGGLLKSEVRELARTYNLPVDEKPDSQDLCFLGGDDYRSFLSQYVPTAVKKGLIVNRQGTVLGEHDGLAFYTIGQRKGLRIAAPQPYYVLEKKLEENIVVVGLAEELGQKDLTAVNFNWILPPEECQWSPDGVLRAQVKIRYKANEALAAIFPQAGGKVQIRFDEPLRDITPGQRAVLYQGDICLGGGKITI